MALCIELGFHPHQQTVAFATRVMESRIACVIPNAFEEMKTVSAGG